MYGLKILTPPTIYPVTLSEAKAHARIDADGDDSQFEELFIPSATAAVEGLTDRQLITAEYGMTLPGFVSRRLYLPKGQFQSIDSVTYYDQENSLQTLDPGLYVVDGTQEPAVLNILPSTSIPATYDRTDAVAIVFTCGYGDAAADVPQWAKLGILMHVTYQFENRGDDKRATKAWELDILRDAVAPYRLGDEFTRYAC